MKHGSWIGVTVVVALILFIPSFARAQYINGWWEVQIPTLKIGDLVTGEWVRFRAAGPNISFIYIFDASENSYGGKACYVERNGVGGSYVKDNTFSVYTRNNIAILTGPSNGDQDGNLVEGSTMVLETLSFKGDPVQMKGLYTKYDIEAEQPKVKMGSVIARKRNPENVPTEVTVLCP